MQHTITPSGIITGVRVCSPECSPDGLGNVPKGVDGGSANSLLVGLQQLQQLKANPHPLFGRDKLCASVCNTTNKVDAILLYFLMSVCVCVHIVGRGGGMIRYGYIRSLFALYLVATHSFRLHYPIMRIKLFIRALFTYTEMDSASI